MTKINLNSTDIMTAVEAAKIWGKSPAYVKTSYRKSSQKWPDGTYRVMGRTIIVTTEGMEAVTGEPDPRKNAAKNMVSKK